MIIINLKPIYLEITHDGLRPTDKSGQASLTVWDIEEMYNIFLSSTFEVYIDVDSFKTKYEKKLGGKL